MKSTLAAIATVIAAAVGLTLAFTVSAATPDWSSLGIDPSVSYSATRHVESSEGQMEMREYRAPDMFRIDVDHEGQRGQMIMREDRNTAYLLMPEMNAYMEIPMQQVMETTGLQAPVVERTEVGRETVLGYSTTKYHTVFDDEGVRSSGHMWVTEHGIPIKWDLVQEGGGGDGERVISELRDLKVTSQDLALFEIPANYQAISLGNIGSMMRGAGQEPSGDTGGTGAGQPSRPSIAEEAAEAAAEAARDEARRTAVDEARRGAREGVRSIFNR